MPYKSAHSSLLAILVLVCTCATAQNNPSSQLREIHVNASQVKGPFVRFRG